MAGVATMAAVAMHEPDRATSAAATVVARVTLAVTVAARATLAATVAARVTLAAAPVSLQKLT